MDIAAEVVAEFAHLENAASDLTSGLGDLVGAKHQERNGCDDEYVPRSEDPFEHINTLLARSRYHEGPFMFHDFSLGPNRLVTGVRWPVFVPPTGGVRQDG